MYQSLICFSQDRTDCEKLLAQEINFDFIEKSDLDELNNTFSKLKDCGLEKVDIEIFANGPVLATLLIEITNKNNQGTKITYKQLFDKIIDFKQTPEYEGMIEIFQISKQLSKTKVNIENWDEDKKLLEKLQIPEIILDEIYSYIQENPNHDKTYKELLTEFIDKQKPIKKDKTLEKESIFSNIGNVSYEELLNKSKELNKPLLIHFTGYASINCRKMENSILSEKSIINKLKNDFYFVNLYLDDKRTLPKSEWKEWEKNGKLIKTIGFKNIVLQIERFNNDTQPYFVIIDNNGKKLKEIGYTMETDEFLDFLKIDE